MIENKDNGQAEEEIILSAEAEDKTEATDDGEDEAVTLSAEPVKNGKQKNFLGMLKRQKIMIIAFASVALVMTVLYFAVLAPKVAKTQEPDPIVPETLVDGEVYDTDGTSILIFPHIEKKNIKSIEVNNSFGSFVCKRAEEENTFYIEEHMQVPFAAETLTQLVVDAGYPTIIRRLTTECEDWSVYGLAEEDNPA